MKVLDDTLKEINDPLIRNRILNWAWDKFSAEPKKSTVEEDTGSAKPKKPTKKLVKKIKTKAKTPPTPKYDKNLNLKPSGKKSFIDFAAEKKPTSNSHKIIVCVYYLSEEIKLPKINPNHIFTCFKVANWRIPKDLLSTLRESSSRTLGIDTSDPNNIRLTHMGENLVQHGLL